MEFAADDAEDGEAFGIGVGDGITGLEGVAVDLKEWAGGEGVAVGFVHGGFLVVEVDALERFADVKLARFSVEAEAVPIEDAVGGVGVLLDFVDEESGADGVESAGGDEDGVAVVRSDGVDVIGDGAVGDGGFELVAGGAVFEADVELGAGSGIGDEPHFCFWFATELWCDGDGWVDLDGEVVPGVEDFDEEREALAFEVFAEEFLAVVGPEFVEGLTGKGAAVDDGLFVGAVGEFPGFAVGLVVGEGAVVDRRQGASAPDAGHVERLEGEGLHGLRMESGKTKVKGQRSTWMVAWVMGSPCGPARGVLRSRPP